MLARITDWWAGKPHVGRSSRWPELRRFWLHFNPTCAVCGNKKNTVPHHVIPVHVNPALELEMANFITLCEGSVFNCHLLFGHLGNWRSWNTVVRLDAAYWSEKIQMRPGKVVKPA